MNSCVEKINQPLVSKLPSWFRQDLPDMKKLRQLKTMFRQSNLHTVCESANCPNLGQCWGRGVATFMILGDICTRACRFCAVTVGCPGIVDSKEPLEIALSVKKMNLRYVVITSVARDDLKDEGAGHFLNVLEMIRQESPQTKVEVLIPDFSNKWNLLKVIVEAKPQVISHNIETVQRLSNDVRSKATYDRSLLVLLNFKKLDSSILTKSSLMLGFGESIEEIYTTLKDLKEVDCDIVTIGQYLAPTKLKRHVPVKKYYSPQEFKLLEKYGRDLGFRHVMSAPLVRSSYIAEEGYKECVSVSN